MAEEKQVLRDSRTFAEAVLPGGDKELQPTQHCIPSDTNRMLVRDETGSEVCFWHVLQFNAYQKETPTPGSVVFVGDDRQAAEDEARFSYDIGYNALGIGTDEPLLVGGTRIIGNGVHIKNTIGAANLLVEGQGGGETVSGAIYLSDIHATSMTRICKIDDSLVISAISKDLLEVRDLVELYCGFLFYSMVINAPVSVRESVSAYQGYITQGYFSTSADTAMSTIQASLFDSALASGVGSDTNRSLIAAYAGNSAVSLELYATYESGGSYLTGNHIVFRGGGLSFWYNTTKAMEIDTDRYVHMYNIPTTTDEWMPVLCIDNAGKLWKRAMPA
jgi:hypothetical protein